MIVLKWKRKNASGQTMSQCGRFWFVQLEVADADGPFDLGMTATGGCPYSFRLWHYDTNTLVGHYDSASECKFAAQSYLDGLKGLYTYEEDNPLDRDDAGPTDDNPVDEFTIDGARIVGTRPLTQTEVDNEIWPAATVALELENGIILYASRDPEGNGPGALFGQYPDGGCFQLGVTNAPECSADTPAKFGPHEQGKWDYRTNKEGER